MEVASGSPFDIVVSGFAIHHRPDDEKRRIYSEIFESLAPGGIFLNLDPVASRALAGEELFDEFFVDHLHRFHRAASPQKSRQEISDTYHWEIVSSLCRKIRPAGNLVADAQHAALAIEHGCRWVTRDADFAGFESHGLEWEHLEPAG